MKIFTIELTNEGKTLQKFPKANIEKYRIRQRFYADELTKFIETYDRLPTTGPDEIKIRQYMNQLKSPNGPYYSEKFRIEITNFKNVRNSSPRPGETRRTLKSAEKETSVPLTVVTEEDIKGGSFDHLPDTKVSETREETPISIAPIVAPGIQPNPCIQATQTSAQMIPETPDSGRVLFGMVKPESKPTMMYNHIILGNPQALEDYRNKVASQPVRDGLVRAPDALTWNMLGFREKIRRTLKNLKNEDPTVEESRAWLFALPCIILIIAVIAKGVFL